jgi:hypothetical protein
MMKIKTYLIQQPLLLMGLLFLFSCGNNEPENTTAKVTVTGKSEKATPFAFYKDISVRPGLNFEVLSWGKGVDSIGGYVLLMSDSVKSVYKSLSNEREGILADAWNMDLDNDGNPEVYLELLIDNKVRSDLHVYEYSNGSFNKITFPGLSSKLKKNYAGKDKFSIRDGDLYRSYSLSGELDGGEKAVGTKTLHYRLSGNSFSASEEEVK